MKGHKYTIMNSTNITILIDKVNDLIREGWMPLGGVCMAIDHNIDDLYKMKYVQAMIKKD